MNLGVSSPSGQGPIVKLKKIRRSLGASRRKRKPLHAFPPSPSPSPSPSLPPSSSPLAERTPLKNRANCPSSSFIMHTPTSSKRSRPTVSSSSKPRSAAKTPLFSPPLVTSKQKQRIGKRRLGSGKQRTPLPTARTSLTTPKVTSTPASTSISTSTSALTSSSSSSSTTSTSTPARSVVNSSPTEALVPLTPELRSKIMKKRDSALEKRRKHLLHQQQRNRVSATTDTPTPTGSCSGTAVPDHAAGGKSGASFVLSSSLLEGGRGGRDAGGEEEKVHGGAMATYSGALTPEQAEVADLRGRLRVVETEIAKVILETGSEKKINVEETIKLEALAAKWLAAAQQALEDLLERANASGNGQSMEDLLKFFSLPPAMVKYNVEEESFE